MMVGPSGSGKSTAWKVLLRALERLEGVEGVAHVIDPKVTVSLDRLLFYSTSRSIYVSNVHENNSESSDSIGVK